MTNEEILFQYVPGEDLYSQIELMLDAARKDEAVAFAEFTCGKFKYNKFYKKWQQLYSNNEFTTEQLYTIFKQKNR